MLLQTADTQAFVRPADTAANEPLTAWSRPNAQGAFFDVLRREVEDFRVGSARYRFRSPLLITFYPRLEGSHGRLTVASALVRFAGRGTTMDEAWKDWAERFHVQFQTLYGMRPWERQPDERDEWERIDQLVDVSAYRRDTPYTIRQIGVLTRRRPIPDRIRWEDGRQESVSLSLMPPEFAALHEGQRFEAEILRDSLTGGLIRGLVVRRLPPLRTTSADEELWETLPTTKEAASVDWDEFD